MPEISRFFGIIIAMFYNDHPPPHFHVHYGSERATIRIEDLALDEGELSPTILGLVKEWAALHRRELLDNWNRARAQSPLSRVEPLE
jgi:Domain of unknown function (DUF4160)